MVPAAVPFADDLHLDLKLAPGLAHLVDGQPLLGRPPQDGAGPEVVLRAVALAHEDGAFQQARRERALLVGAQAVEGVEAAVRPAPR